MLGARVFMGKKVQRVLQNKIKDVVLAANKTELPRAPSLEIVFES